MTTTRDPDALKIRKWADTGDRTDPDDATLSPALDRAIGWPQSFSDPEGDTPRREVFNQLLAEVTAALHEVLVHGGMLPYDDRIAYQHPAFVIGTDTRIYRSKQNSTGQNPVTDATRTYWEPLINTVSGLIAPSGVAQASEAAAGVSEWANQTEMDNGDAQRVARPSVILNWFQRAAVAAARITGVLDAARIPSLNASKINAGQFTADRIPRLPVSKVRIFTGTVAVGSQTVVTSPQAGDIYAQREA